MKSWTTGAGLFSVIVLLASSALAAVPEAPKVSTFAPNGDLTCQMKSYVEDLCDLVKTESEFEDNQDKVARSASVVSVLAMTLGVDDQDNCYKPAASAILKASQALADAKDYAAAKKACDQLVAAVDAKDCPPAKWEKAASLKNLMAAVPLISAKIRSSHIKKEKRFKKKAEQFAGYTAVLAAIGQASMYNADETDKPGEADKWYAACGDFREKAAAVNKTIHDGDSKACLKAVEAMKLSCEACHETFHQEEK